MAFLSMMNRSLNVFLNGIFSLPESAETALQKSGKRGFWVKPLIYVVLVWMTFRMSTPYRMAKYYIAYDYYTKTEMYRIRRVELNPKFANESFAQNREDKLFLRHLTFKDKLSAFFTPWVHFDRYFRETF